VIDRSYRDRNVVADAQVDRTLRVLSGGPRSMTRVEQRWK
jgi:hypothetical protein